MKNNTYEEFFIDKSKPLNENISNFHENSVSKMGLPPFVKFSCPFCKADLTYRSIRAIGTKFNARNIGDLFVEFMCWECKMGDTLYFPRQVESMQDFVDLLQNKKQPNTDGIIEEVMFKQMYNNLIKNFSNAFEKEHKNGDA